MTVAEVGDDIGEVLNDECLFLVNHQCTGDVVYLMQLLCASGRCCAGRHVCWILDNMFKYTPFGLASRVHGDFFILQVLHSHYQLLLSYYITLVSYCQYIIVNISYQ